MNNNQNNFEQKAENIPNFQLRWVIPRYSNKYKHEIWGEKWISEKVQKAERILQYSLDGENWNDVESVYQEVQQNDVHKYSWK